MRGLQIGMTLLVGLALSACAINRPADKRAATCALPITRIGVTLPGSEIAALPAIRGAMTSIADSKGTQRRIRSLVLSGGGQHGSFGSGFLTGMQNAGTLPRYDIVTGVSTGALQATFAFLGQDVAPADRILTPADDFAPEAASPTRTNVDDTVSGYMISREATLYIDKGTTGIIRRAAKGSLAPLVTRLNKMITPQTLRAVAAAGAANRKLYVAMLNYDTADEEVVDMTALAARFDGSNFGAVQYCYNQVLLASSSEPIGAPPVSIDGKLYFDGALRYAVFLKDILDNSAAVSGAGSLSFETDIIVNDDLTVDPDPPTKTKLNILDIAGRARLIVVDQIYLFSISDILAARLPGHTIRFAAIRPAEKIAAAPTKGATFDPAYMKRMIAIGRARGARGDWQSSSEMTQLKSRR
jgi:predicted acylesterase/phospholipase RssA